MLIGLAIAGAALGAVRFSKAYNNQTAEADAKRKELEKQQEELKRAYEAKKKEDTDLANLKDKQLTKSEGYLSAEAANTMESLGLQQQSNALSVQNQQISNSNETGSALANAATSGIRSGSVMDSIDRSDAYAAQLLEANREALNQQTELSFKQAQLGIMQNMDSITGNRYQNNATRRSYEAGGYNYEKFKASYDQISRQIYDLRTDVKDNAFSRNRLNMWDAFGAMFSGGATLANFGANINELNKSY